MSDITPTSLQFNFIKSNYFRVIHADGAMGSPSTRGGIFFSLFSERAAMPESTVYTLKENGALGDEETSKRRSKPGVVREIEVGVSMDLSSARAFHTWLGQTLLLLETEIRKRDKENA